ncbi:hypothetical protein ES705_19596 [subsurface metagenome]
MKSFFYNTCLKCRILTIFHVSIVMYIVETFAYLLMPKTEFKRNLTK